jgi:molybdate transport system substrate-binding protein
MPAMPDPCGRVGGMQKSRVRRVVTALVAASLACAMSAACSSSKKNSGSRSSGNQISGTIHVFAAASLTEVFTDLGKQFEKDYPGTEVVFQFAASSALATNIDQGDKADVFASASPRNMQSVVDAGNASDPKTFAKNEMEIAVPPDNPGNVASLDDLAKPGVKVALCQPQVPCGKTAQQVFTNAKITVKPVTEQPDVKSTLQQVENDAVDAGVVYVTDAKSAGGKVKGVEISADVNASTAYPIAVIKSSGNKPTAQAWVDLVLSGTGQSALKAAGFLSP